MGGKGVLDFKPGLGLYVRDGKTQPNFAAVMRDHPEGIGNAVQNSKKMQSSMSAGFVPNFAGIDPMSLFFMMQSMGGAGGGSEQMASKLERDKLAQILRDRRASQQLLKQEENKELPLLLCVQVIPSLLYTILFIPFPTATHIEPLYAIS